MGGQTREAAAAGAARNAADKHTGHSTSEDSIRLILGLLLFVGVWGTIAPYLGPTVPVASNVEVVDHVVPGVIVLGVVLSWLHLKRLELITAALGWLAGLWMVATHVPLVAQAARGEATWEGALWMFVPSAAIFGLMAWAVLLAWRD